MKSQIKVAFKNLTHRKKRSWLTILGVLIGIAAIVSLISLGQGLRKSITDQFEMMGADKVMITPTGGIFGVGATTKLTQDDLDRIRYVRGIKLASGLITKQAKITYHGKSEYTWVSGIPLGEEGDIIESMQQMEIGQGRDLEERDMYMAVIAIDVAKDEGMFNRGVRLNSKIEIDGKDFDVVGILERIGNPEDDKSIIIPLESAKDIFEQGDTYDMLIVQVEEDVDIAWIKKRIERELRKIRDVDEGEEDFNVQTSEELLESFGTILDIVTYVLIGIASISLLVGGVGIMNTMYTSVMERTKDIGIMKSIGARNSDIMTMFLLESGMLGFAGGVIGILIGVGISKLVEFGAVQSGITIFKAYFPWYLILFALLFSFLVGSLSGLWPAWKASQMNPVEAVRYE